MYSSCTMSKKGGAVTSVSIGTSTDLPALLRVSNEVKMAAIGGHYSDVTYNRKMPVRKHISLFETSKLLYDGTTATVVTAGGGDLQKN